MNPYKEGDIVVHIQGTSSYQGAGWKEDAIWEVYKRMESSSSCVWTKTGNGVFPEYVRYATPEEVQWFLQGNPSINNMPKIQYDEIY